MKQEKIEKLVGAGMLSIFCSLCLGMATKVWIEAEREKNLAIKVAKANYAIPSKIQTKMEDVDKNGTYESTFEYNGKKQLMQYDPNSNTVRLIPYELNAEEAK